MKQTILVHTAIGKIPVEAYVVGEWAYHRAYGGRPGWTVTHLPSGYKVGHKRLPEPCSYHMAKKIAYGMSRMCAAWHGGPQVQEDFVEEGSRILGSIIPTKPKG